MKRILFLALLMVSQLGFGQSALHKDITDLVLEALTIFPKVPGLSIAVTQGQAPVYVKAFGYANLESKVPSTPETPYYIASSTKSYVGLLSVILQEKGIIDLDAPITNYSPIKGFKNQDLFRNVTIRELLSHTSGIHNPYIAFRQAVTGDYTDADMVRLLEVATVQLETGKAFRYSNFGFNLLDIILRSETGKDWRDLLDRYIFTPAGLSGTSGYVSEIRQGKHLHAWPYFAFGSTEKGPKKVTLMKDDNTMQAAGGLMTTANDAAKWLLLNINEGKLNGNQALKAEWFRQIHGSIAKYSKQESIFKESGYGLGWVNGEYEGHKSIHHYGDFEGFVSHISFLPKEQIGVAIFVNESSLGREISEYLSEYIYQYLLGENPDPTEYKDAFKALAKGRADFEVRIAKNTAERKQRTWQLELPQEAYLGNYYNELIGTIELKIRRGQLYLKMGNAGCVLEPFTQKNSMRAEINMGRGEVIQFQVSDGKVISLNYDGELLSKIN